jgi:hypothetical protein
MWGAAATLAARIGQEAFEARLTDSVHEYKGTTVFLIAYLDSPLTIVSIVDGSEVVPNRKSATICVSKFSRKRGRSPRIRSQTTSDPDIYVGRVVGQQTAQVSATPR